MSNLGIKIVQEAIESVDGASVDRCFAPWTDFGTSLKENNMELIDDMSRDTTDFPVLVLSLYKIGAEYFYSDSTIYPKLGRNDYRKRFQQEYSLVPLRNYEIANLLSEKRASILYDYINFALKKIGFDC